MSIEHISDPLRQFAVPIEALRKDPRNARLHPDRNLHAIRQSLRKFGQQKPIVLNEDGITIIAGNGTVEAAALEGWTHVAAIRSKLDGADATAFGLADNRTAETAEWDYGAVSDLIKELQSIEYDLPALGWADYELEPLLAVEWRPTAATPMTEFDDAAKRAQQNAAARQEREQAQKDNTVATSTPSASEPGVTREWEYIQFTDDQVEIVRQAVEKLRTDEGDQEIPEGRAIELICADWLAGA